MKKSDTKKGPDRSGSGEVQSPIPDEVRINYTETDVFSGDDGVYEFKVPKGLFKRTAPNLYKSAVLDATLTFIAHYGHYLDEEPLFTKKDLIKIYKPRVQPDYFVDKANWFVISYDLPSYRSVYLKGFYESLISMQGRDEGEPTWVWSKGGVLKMEYSKKYQREFDKLIPFIIKSFSCNLYIL